MAGGEISYLFIVRPGDGGRIGCVLRRGRFSYPIYVSSSSVFGGLGGFPTGVVCRAFLLSTNGGMITVKGPVRGSEVGGLCLSVVSKGGVASGGKDVRARVAISRALFSFKGVSFGRSRGYVFALRGANGTLLIVSSIGASYNYASMRCSGRPIGPKRSLEVAIVCGTSRPRRFEGAVAVCYGIPASPLRLGVAKGTRWFGICV